MIIVSIMINDSIITLKCLHQIFYRVSFVEYVSFLMTLQSYSSIPIEVFYPHLMTNLQTGLNLLMSTLRMIRDTTN